MFEKVWHYTCHAETIVTWWNKQIILFYSHLKEHEISFIFICIIYNNYKTYLKLFFSGVAKCNIFCEVVFSNLGYLCTFFPLTSTVFKIYRDIKLVKIYEIPYSFSALVPCCCLIIAPVLLNQYLRILIITQVTYKTFFFYSLPQWEWRKWDVWHLSKSQNLKYKFIEQINSSFLFSLQLYFIEPLRKLTVAFFIKENLQCSV